MIHTRVVMWGKNIVPMYNRIVTSNQPPKFHESARLQKFDYSQPGGYFVTIVTANREHLFGQIVEGRMVLNPLGEMVAAFWKEMPRHFSNISVGEFVVMPNHMHGILLINDPDAPRVTDKQDWQWVSPLRKSVGSAEGGAERFGKPIRSSLPTIIRSFKSAVTKRYREMTKNPGGRVWQLNYYEHVIRNERDYQAIHDYIVANPINWEKDEENIYP